MSKAVRVRRHITLDLGTIETVRVTCKHCDTTVEVAGTNVAAAVTTNETCGKCGEKLYRDVPGHSHGPVQLLAKALDELRTTTLVRVEVSVEIEEGI